MVLLLAVYGGLKFYVHSSVKSRLDDAAMQMQPFGSLSYEDIETDLRGRVVVNGLAVSLFAQGFSARLAKLELAGKDPRILLALSNGLEQGDLPEQMRVDLRGVEFSDISEFLPPSLLFQSDDDPCSLRSIIRTVGILQSDRYPPLMDAELSWLINPDQGFGHGEFDFKVIGGGSVNVEFALSNMPIAGALQYGVAPTVERLVVNYRPNTEAVLEAVNHCVSERKTRPPAFVDSLLDAPDKELAAVFGVVPGPGLKAAIRSFLLAPKELRLQMGPLSDPSDLVISEDSVSPAQLRDLLNLRVLVNEQTVDDLDFWLPTDESMPAPAATGIPKGSQAERKAQRRARYMDTPVEELRKYEGRLVKVHTKGRDNPHHGVLVSVGANEVSVEKKIRRGALTVHISMEHIERVEVMRFPPK